VSFLEFSTQVPGDFFGEKGEKKRKEGEELDLRELSSSEPG
jgi:hypothetical protein